MNTSIFGKLHCSETMKLSLRQSLFYLRLTGREEEELSAEWEERFCLPCRDRRAGKEILRKIEKATRETPLPLRGRPGAMRPFTRICAEKEALKNARAGRILSFFPGLPVQEITHYKDVFCRSAGGESGRTLILAEKKGTLLYPGAPVCQDFGNRHFYYASCAMNCVFDCEYCYLKGMYPSDDMVVFLNLEDYFAQTEMLLRRHPIYLCVSFDTDLTAVEGFAGFGREWSAFAAEHPGVTVELRTKSADSRVFSDWTVSPQLILAFTLSPEPVASAYEHGAAAPGKRLAAAKAAMEKGFPVRLCFDPVLFCEDWEKVYGKLLTQTAESLDLQRVRDIGVGTFRISREYLKTMRHRLPDSPVAQYPYVNDRGVCGYPEELDEQMRDFFLAKLTKNIEKERIFWWKSRDSCDKVEK